MVDYTALLHAKPQAWDDRAAEWIAVAVHTTQCAADLVVGVRNLNIHWPDEAGALNVQELTNLAEAYGQAGDTCKNVARTLQSLADAAHGAQSDLQLALANAKANSLTVSDNGVVTGSGDKTLLISQIAASINHAVAAATTADQDAAGQLNSFTSQVGSPSPDPGSFGVQPDVQIQAGAVNATGKALVNLANDAQTANSKLLAHSETGMETQPDYGGNDSWTSTVALGFCAYRWRQHLDSLVNRLSAVGSGVTASAKNYDAADQEAASLLNNVFTDMKR